MLTTMNELLVAARKEKRAVGAFNVGNYETLLAVFLGAESAGLPVIVQFYERVVNNGHGEPLVAAARALAERSSVPVAIHLDHGSTLEVVARAIAAGCTSVMIDGSRLSFDENVAITLEAVKLARAAGVTIEAEIGHVAQGDEGRDANLQESVKFFEATGVDALAVAVGTAHGFYAEEPKIDLTLASQLADAIPVPLVLHGGSGTPQDKVRALIASGFAKINVATEFQYDYQLKLKARLNEVQKFFAVDLLEAPVVDSSAEFIAQQLKFFAGVK